MGLDFNGSSHHIDCGDLGLTNGVSALSVGCVFKSDITSSADGLFNFDGNEFYLTVEGNQLYLVMNAGAFVQGTAFTDTTSWHSAYGVYTGSAGIIYLDGQKVVDSAHSTDLDLSGVDFEIARYSTNFYFDGKIADLRVYNRVLTEDETDTIWRSQGNDGIVNGLIANYRMNEKSAGKSASSGSSIIDISTNAKHGIPTGGLPTYIETPLNIIKPR
jgi:hypothetical protein